MTLPTDEQLTELSGLIVKEGKRIHGKWYTFKGMKQTLDRSGADLTVSVVGHGAGTVMTKGAAVAGVATGSVLIPFGLDLDSYYLRYVLSLAFDILFFWRCLFLSL